jgi:hypothetical protein
MEFSVFIEDDFLRKAYKTAKPPSPGLSPELLN